MGYKNYKKEDLFTCYSLNLFHFLKSNNFRYIHREFNQITTKACWLFERSPELLEAVTIYTNNK